VAGLDWFNALPPQQAERELLACCASPAWARHVAGGRPYPDIQSLVDAGGAAVESLPWEDVAEALAAHPRIGDRPAGDGRDAAWSRREQAGVAKANDRLLDALAEANRLYEERFGHVFLIFASGHTARQMLAAARERVDNDEATERDVVRGELGKITRLRLERLLT
jgi:2-oxo-4-hydroxy-4-carboxy-5-ureidoimidazoline decarboxylase